MRTIRIYSSHSLGRSDLVGGQTSPPIYGTTAALACMHCALQKGVVSALGDSPICCRLIFPQFYLRAYGAAIYNVRLGTCVIAV